MAFANSTHHHCPVSGHTPSIQADSLATPSNLKIVFPFLLLLACEINSRIQKVTVTRIIKKKVQEQVGMAVPKKYRNKSTKQEYLQTRCIPTVFHRNSVNWKNCVGCLNIPAQYSCFDTFLHCHPYLLL